MKGAFFNSPESEMMNLLCGIGKSRIGHDSVTIENYPFEPSSVFPGRTVPAAEIVSVQLDATPPVFQVGGEMIFISAGYKLELEQFALRNGIPVTRQTLNWDNLLDPFLDTEFSQDYILRTSRMLEKNGFEPAEIEAIRNEVSEQMYKYNFDTMLWEWVSLGLADVLSAMRVKYDRDRFRDFYRRAMEIEIRGMNGTGC